MHKDAQNINRFNYNTRHEVLQVAQFSMGRGLLLFSLLLFETEIFFSEAWTNVFMVERLNSTLVKLWPMRFHLPHSVY